MSAEKLSDFFRGLARLVYREGGGFRRLENLGVRPVAFPVRKSGIRYDEVRWVIATFDVTPSVLETIGAFVLAEKDVLQFKYMASKDRLAEFNAKPPGERRKKLSAAMRWGGVQFDPDTLSMKENTGELR